MECPATDGRAGDPVLAGGRRLGTGVEAVTCDADGDGAGSSRIGELPTTGANSDAGMRDAATGTSLFADGGHRA
jgi:hypothetical protein